MLLSRGFVACLALLLMSAAQQVEACKGYFCDEYLDTMFILMTHNSFAVNPPVAFPNQAYSEPQQFKDGIRGFNMDMYEDANGEIYMKHGRSPGEVNYQVRVDEILNVMKDDPNAFLVVRFEDHMTTLAGVKKACEAWGDKLIQDFDINKPLGDYISLGKQVLLLTNVGSHVDSSLGMHNSQALLAENEYQWTDPDKPPRMDYRRGPNGGNQRYATLMNYFCTTPTINAGSRTRSSTVNAKARLQCHAKEFKEQSYAQGKFNILMIDNYHLPSNKENAFDLQAAIRNGNFDQDVASCVSGSQPSCKATGSSCNFFGSCGDCCEGSSCRFWIFGCKCSS